MLKKLYVTYLVPFKTVSVKESEELQRFFDSISQTDFQFIDVNKLLEDSVNANEQHATHVEKRVPIDYTEIDDDLVVVIDFRRLFNDVIDTTDVSFSEVHKQRRDNIDPADRIEIEFDVAPIFDAIGSADQFDRVVSFIRGIDDSVGVLESIQHIDSDKVMSSALLGVYDTISMSSTDYEYCDVYMNDVMTYVNQFIRKIDDSISFTEQLIKDLVTSRSDIALAVDTPYKLYQPAQKQDVFLYQPDEDGLLSKDTYIDAQYYYGDYVESTNVAFKTIYELLSASDVATVIPNYGKFDSVVSGDLGGSLLNTTYMDSGYMSGNYIGTTASF